MTASRVLIASDLDSTLIYSRRRLETHGSAPALRGVETLDGVTSSFMTESAALSLARISARRDFVPATARTAEQYLRVRLPATSRYAVVANGGTLLVDGVPDRAWARQVALNLRSGWDFDPVLSHARSECAAEWTTSIRAVDALFCYASVITDLVPDEWLARQRAWATARGWRTSLQGHKFYWVPDALTKSAAVAEVARRSDCAKVIAAGDALLDVDLLEYADLGVHPNHGELASIGWSAPGVTRLHSCGVAAGQEIVEWFEAAALKLTGGADGGGAASVGAPARLPAVNASTPT